MKYLNQISLILLLIVGASQTLAAQTTVDQISPIRAKLMARNGAVMVDVREKNEVAALAYDVDGILLIPLSELESRMKELPKDKQLIMACASGNRSQKAANMLLKNGYTKVVNMEGGMMAWQEKNLEVIANGKTTKKACCANPNSKDCNPDGTCKNPKKATTKCCSGSAGTGKKCCAKGGAK